MKICKLSTEALFVYKDISYSVRTTLNALTLYFDGESVAGGGRDAVAGHAQIVRHV